MDGMTKYLHNLIFPGMLFFRMPEKAYQFSRYLPPDRQSRNWGWRLLDAGRQVIVPGAPYPNRGHPLGYLFDASGKRTLDEYQIVHISEGRGTFESATVDKRSVSAGDCLLVFPDEWHRYRPDPETGWSEYWLGFKGKDAERVMGSFFDSSDAILHPVQTNEIIRLFEQLLYWVQQPVTGVEQILASHIPMLLAFMQTGPTDTTQAKWENMRLIMEAKTRMLNSTGKRTNLQELATSLGISYSKFRTVFKEHTGYSPREYENRINLNHACELLRSRQYSVTATADALGYSSVYYFSRAFKKQFGCAPREWIKDHR
jgi:AraC-like DNA-binding protein